mmetsp:Transcript_11007/g.15421  ORF Transcript_11007/g.15421 Transcript_11007/m.15421 type:complete len:207 (-) Transcript_11007:947-1567(-)
MSEIFMDTKSMPSAILSATSFPSIIVKFTYSRGLPEAASWHGFLPGFRFSVIFDPPTLIHSTRSVVPSCSSKSVSLILTVSLHFRDVRLKSSTTRTVVAVHPGSSQLKCWESLVLKICVTVVVTVTVVVVVVGGNVTIGRAKQATATIPLKWFPFTGHSSTAGEILPEIFSSPFSSIRPSNGRSRMIGYRSNSWLALDLPASVCCD